MDYTSVQPPSPRWEEKGEKGITGFTHRYGLHFGLLQWLAALGILRFQAQPLAFQRLVPALMLGPVSLHTREVQRGEGEGREDWGQPTAVRIRTSGRYYWHLTRGARATHLREVVALQLCKLEMLLSEQQITS